MSHFQGESRENLLVLVRATFGFGPGVSHFEGESRENLSVFVQRRTHKRPIVGVSRPRSWSHFLVFVNIWREPPTFPEKSVKIDF